MGPRGMTSLVRNMTTRRCRSEGLCRVGLTGGHRPRRVGVCVGWRHGAVVGCGAAYLSVIFVVVLAGLAVDAGG